MSLQNLLGRSPESLQVVDDDSVLLESMSDEAIASIITIAMESSCSEEELDEVEEKCCNNDEPITENLMFAPVLERSIIKLDKKAKKQQAYKMAVLQVAKEMDLPDYKKWCTLKKCERVLMARMEQKTHTKAMAYMRESAKKAKQSTQNPIKKAANALSRSMQRTQNALKGNNKLDPKLKSQTQQITNRIR